MKFKKEHQTLNPKLEGVVTAQQSSQSPELTRVLRAFSTLARHSACTPLKRGASVESRVKMTPGPCAPVYKYMGSCQNYYKVSGLHRGLDH